MDIKKTVLVIDVLNSEEADRDEDLKDTDKGQIIQSDKACGIIKISKL